MVSSSEQDLLHRLRAGDPSAFERLYESHYDRLWRFAYSFVRTRAVAQEIVHDVFLSVWTRRETLPVQSSIDGYLYGAVRNHALKIVRHERIVERELAAALSEQAEQGEDSPNGTPQDRLEREETTVALQKAIEALPERQRTAILLRWKHGMRYEEVASALEVSPQAARTLVLRVQATLKQLIDRVR